MRRAVLDTNVLVSAALSPHGAPARVVDAVTEGRLEPVVSKPIMAEYVEVLGRTRFGFSDKLVNRIIQPFGEMALVVDPGPVNTDGFPDPDDAIFIAAARFACCPVITGNIRHFPPKSGIEVLTVIQAAEWVDKA